MDRDRDALEIFNCWNFFNYSRHPIPFPQKGELLLHVNASVNRLGVRQTPDTTCAPPVFRHNLERLAVGDSPYCS